MEYSYDWPQRILTSFFTFVFAGVSLYLIAVVIAGLVRWFIIYDKPPNMELRDIIGGSIGLTSMAIITGTMIATFANLKPNLRVSDKGLEVQNFLFLWHLIPWEEVKDIRSVPIIIRPGVYLVIARKLPFFNRLIGTMYFAFFQPAFLIGPEISNYDDLVHLIKKKLGKELWE